MTSHDATSWNVHRDTMREHAHDVDGVQYIGGRGQRLDALLDATYIEEAHQLGNDLAECLAKLPPLVAQQTLDGMKGALDKAAEGRHALRSVVHVGEQGPEPTDGMTTGELDAIDVGTFTDDGSVAEPRRGRGRRRDDAAAALTDQREPGAGVVADAAP